MRALEIFAGCGGQALGWHRAGVEHVGLVERDEYAAAEMVERREADARNSAAVGKVVLQSGDVLRWGAVETRQGDTAHMDGAGCAVEVRQSYTPPQPIVQPNRKQRRYAAPTKRRRLVRPGSRLDGPSLADAPSRPYLPDLTAELGLTTEREHRRPRLRALGNACAVDVAEFIAREVMP